MIHQVCKEMYLSDRRIPKCLVIDEAWEPSEWHENRCLIEGAFRRARKYNGIRWGSLPRVLRIFEKSAAAKAAIETLAWQFILLPTR